MESQATLTRKKWKIAKTHRSCRCSTHNHRHCEREPWHLHGKPKRNVADSRGTGEALRHRNEHGGEWTSESLEGKELHTISWPAVRFRLPTSLCSCLFLLTGKFKSMSQKLALLTYKWIPVPREHWCSCEKRKYVKYSSCGRSGRNGCIQIHTQIPTYKISPS